MFNATVEAGSQNLLPLPWRVRYTPEFKLLNWGVGKETPLGGIFSQFPDIDWAEETDSVMEQLTAAQRRLTDFPEPGFKTKKILVPLFSDRRIGNGSAC